MPLKYKKVTLSPSANLIIKSSAIESTTKVLKEKAEKLYTVANTELKFTDKPNVNVSRSYNKVLVDVQYKNYKTWLHFFGSGKYMDDASTSGNPNPYLRDYMRSDLWNKHRKGKEVVRRGSEKQPIINWKTGRSITTTTGSEPAGEPLPSSPLFDRPRAESLKTRFGTLSNRYKNTGKWSGKYKLTTGRDDILNLIAEDTKKRIATKYHRQLFLVENK